MATVIRPYQKEDIPQIMELYNQIVAEGDAYLSEEPYSIKEMTDRVNNTPSTFVSETNGELSGGYFLKPNFKGRAGHIANATYFVSKEFRGQGIGRLLGEHSIVISKKLGFSAVQFNSVVATNLAAMNLWNSLGFRTIGVIPNGFRTIDQQFVDLNILFREL